MWGATVMKLWIMNLCAAHIDRNKLIITSFSRVFNTPYYILLIIRRLPEVFFSHNFCPVSDIPQCHISENPNISLRTYIALNSDNNTYQLIYLILSVFITTDNLENRMQEEITIWGLIIVPSRGWKSLNIWEKL